MQARDKWCAICDQERMHHNDRCVECEERARREARVMWIALPSDEKIEALLRRIERLEKSPARY